MFDLWSAVVCIPVWTDWHKLVYFGKLENRSGWIGADPQEIIMTSAFDPYHKWLGISPAEQPPNHYRLLGIPDFETDLQVIDAAADRQLTFLRKLQLGQHQREANELLNEVTRAWRVLAKPASKNGYDAQLAAMTDRAVADAFAAGRRSQPVLIWTGVALAGLAGLASLIWFALPRGIPPAQEVPVASTASETARPAMISYPAVKPVEQTKSVPGMPVSGTTAAVAEANGTSNSNGETRSKVEIVTPEPAPPIRATPKTTTSNSAVRSADYHLPAHVSVLPVAFVPKDQQPPTNDETAKFFKHVTWAQNRYRELLFGDTFDIAQPDVKIVPGQRPLDFYRAPPERGAPDIVSELLTNLKVTRFQCPYVFCILLMNSKDSFPEGGGRPINGGLNTGGGMMYISSQQLAQNDHFQCTLQHELGHAFGLVHVDAYSYDMGTNASLMSYNPAHHNKGFTPSATPGVLIPEDRRSLALNRRVFANFTFDPKRDVPAIYPLSKRIRTLGPMVLPGQPDFYPQVTTNGGEDQGSKVANALSGEIFPSIGPGLNYVPDAMWHSVHRIPQGSADLEITFPMAVQLSGISIHSQHSAMDHHAASMKLQTMDSAVGREVVSQSLTKFDELVRFPLTTSRKWRLNLTPGKSQTLVIRGLRFFDGDQEVFPHQVPYRNSSGIDDLQPATPASETPALAQAGTPGRSAAALRHTGAGAVPTTGGDASKTLSTTANDSGGGPGGGQPTEETGASSVKAAVPDQAAQAEAKKTVKEQFKNEYTQAKKSAGKVELATALIEKAVEITEANAIQYVMLLEALDIGADADNNILAEQAIAELVKRFEVRPFALKERLVSARPFTGKNYQDGVELLTKYAELAQAAAKEEDYATAVKSMSSAAIALKKPLFKPLKEFAVLESKRYSNYQDSYAVAKPARDKLAASPDDAVANLMWGRFLCCFQQDWAAGLPLLAKCEDKVWKSLAERELNRPTRPAELLQLGDDWFKAGDKEKDPVQFQARDRANAAWLAALASAQEAELAKVAQQVDQRTTKLFDKSLVVAKGDAAGVPLMGTESLNPGPEFTIEFWVNTTSKQGVLVTKQHNGADSSMRARMSIVDGDSMMHFEHGHASGGGGTAARNQMSDGHWHHFALVRHNQDFKYYQDGKAIGGFAPPGVDEFPSSSPWKLGCGKGFPPLAGQFARVRISNVARYTNSFVPQKQFIRDLSTLYLR